MVQVLLFQEQWPGWALLGSARLHGHPQLEGGKILMLRPGAYTSPWSQGGWGSALPNHVDRCGGDGSLKEKWGASISKVGTEAGRQRQGKT